MFTLSTSLNPLLLEEGGDTLIEVTVKSKEKNLKTFVPIASNNSASGQKILPLL
jgi:hypothetical protein